MNKLEKKLRELGYKTYNGYAYLKPFFVNDYYFQCLIALNKSKTKVKDYFLETPVFRTYEVVNAFLEQFNKFQNDLEILKAIDKPTPKSKNDIGNELLEKDVKHMQELGEWERKQWNY